MVKRGEEGIRDSSEGVVVNARVVEEWEGERYSHVERKE